MALGGKLTGSGCKFFEIQLCSSDCVLIMLIPPATELLHMYNWEPVGKASLIVLKMEQEPTGLGRG